MSTFRSFDGTAIAYELHGTDGPPIVFVNGLACDKNYWRYALSHFAPRHRLVTYDLRGHGKSAHPASLEHVGIEHHARDLHELIAHLGLRAPVVTGFSLGVQIMFESYRRLAEEVAGLVAVTGPYRNPAASFYGIPFPEAVIDSVFGVVNRIEKPLAKVWTTALSSPAIYPFSKLVGATKATKEDMAGFYRHAANMDAGLFFRFAHAASKHTAEEVLPTIQVPTLIIGAEKDTFTPPSLSSYMAEKIPGAEYLLVKGGTHTALIEEPELINTRIERFLAERVLGGRVV
jgi:pimeloyl-ACP methyl ester carboxylesterase